MDTVFFALPGNEKLTTELAGMLKAEIGEAVIRQFPDGESYVRICTEVKDKRVILVCTLNEPDDKLLPLFFFSKTAKSMGAGSVCIVAPYLAYMRQDKQFNPGEAVTSEYFAALVSTFADQLITVDPHLHRHSALSEIYSIPTTVVHAADHISTWIKLNVKQPVLVGPDEESEQWVSAVAKAANAPFTVLQKQRLGDNDVKVSVPQVDAYKNHTPVLVDDIISTARTMIETVGHLQRAGMAPPVCIGVHGVFANNAYEKLKQAGAQQIVTCNTIIHESNAINLSDMIAAAL